MFSHLGCNTRGLMEFSQLWKLKFTWLNRVVKYNKGENLPEGMGWKERRSISWWGSFAQKFKPWGAIELICLASTRMPTYHHSIGHHRLAVMFGSTTLQDKMASPGSQRLLPWRESFHLGARKTRQSVPLIFNEPLQCLDIGTDTEWGSTRFTAPCCKSPRELQEGVDESQACPQGHSSHSLFYNVIWALYYPLWRNTSKDRKVSDTKGAATAYLGHSEIPGTERGARPQEGRLLSCQDTVWRPDDKTGRKEVCDVTKLQSRPALFRNLATEILEITGWV